VSESLESLLEQARAAAPNDRITYRDRIAAHGAPAIDAMVMWLADPLLWRFAVRTIGRAADLGARHEAIEALRTAGSQASAEQRVDIDAELARLGAPGIVRSGAYGPIDDSAIRDRLIAAAKRGEVVNYADLAKAAGRPMKGRNWAVHIGRILGRISSEEAAQGRPLLTVIVVSRETGLPGGGFFNLGQELHLVKPGEDEDAFVARQTQRVFEYWQSKGAAR
jgi:alkylated DNA nucleotide flippase Atl1